MNSIMCQAISKRLLLEFEYEGFRRVVAPYCHGVSTRDTDVLRGVQVAGASRSGGLGTGKLWNTAKMVGLRMSSKPFTPDDPRGS
jgi:hypothetical protein